MIDFAGSLNDGSILSIAYDRVHYKHQPEAWNMRLVIGMATVLGVVGPIAAFGLFYLGDEVFHLGHPQLQTLMYLTLSVAGSMTIYLTRTRGPFWSIRPARIRRRSPVDSCLLRANERVIGCRAQLFAEMVWRFSGKARNLRELLRTSVAAAA